MSTVETSIKISLTNTYKITAALDKVESKLTELREAISELEKVEMEVQIN